MQCPKCGSNNVNIQNVQQMYLKNKHHGILYWLFIGWWLQPMLWIFFPLWMLLISIFGDKKQKMVTKNKRMAICQNCGYSWRVW